MIFSSPRFLIFLAVLLLLLAPRYSLRSKLNVLLAGSCLFYAAWDWRYLGLLLLISVVNYQCGARIAAAAEPRRRRAWLAASVTASLGVLGWFKYAGFFVENLNLALAGTGLALPAFQVLLPAGISFYTFKTMSYTIDIYRRELEPSHSLLHYATYVTFFPELIAGPIVRASVFLPQMGRAIGPGAARLQLGASIFLLGLSKKLLIADPLSTVVDPVFAAPAAYAPATLWMATLAYTLQIYCDFSGYSDMAVGVSKMVGYDLPRNFRMPYLSASPAEFWRRWHITLSTWLRDYLYIPLGGNRQGRARTYLNLGLTMLLGGLWHGASWNFVLWGGLHGAALALHRAASELRGGRALLPIPVAMPLTFLFVLLCWVPFRAPDFDTTWLMLQRMFSLGAEGALWAPTWLGRALALVVGGHLVGWLLDGAAEHGRGRATADRLLALVGARLESDPISGWYVRLGVGSFGGALLVTLWVSLLFYFGFVGTSPFIYFQF